MVSLMKNYRPENRWLHLPILSFLILSAPVSHMVLAANQTFFKKYLMPSTKKGSCL